MIKDGLARMEKVALRDVWEHEAHDFTTWLASDENLQLLGGAIHKPLKLIGIEQAIGAFRADMIARDVRNDHYVIIENQIEPTDHAHLGQIITYASNLKASTIVWIAAQFRPEHKAAIEWLNETNISSVHFIGVEIELFRIGHSPIAPHFKVVTATGQGIYKASNVDKMDKEVSIDVPGISPLLVKRVLRERLSGTKWRDIAGNYSRTIKPIREAYEAYLTTQMH